MTTSQPSPLGRRSIVAVQPEPGQHTERVVVGAPADVRQHARGGLGAEWTESLGAQLDCRPLELVGVVAGDEHLDLPTAGRHRGEVGVDDARAGLGSQPGERRHAVA